MAVSGRDLRISAAQRDVYQWTLLDHPKDYYAGDSRRGCVRTRAGNVETFYREATKETPGTSTFVILSDTGEPRLAMRAPARRGI